MSTSRLRLVSYLSQACWQAIAINRAVTCACCARLWRSGTNYMGVEVLASNMLLTALRGGCLCAPVNRKGPPDGESKMTVNAAIDGLGQTHGGIPAPERHCPLN